MPWSRRFALKGLFVGSLAVAGCTRDTPPAPREGDVFPSFALPDPDGNTHASRIWNGKPLMINFWATWCPPCRAEMADLNALYRRLEPRGLGLVAISVDTDVNLVREYLLREPLAFQVLIDGNQTWSKDALGIPGFPTTYLIGRDGRIAAMWVGPRRWADDAWASEIARRAGLD